jgi:hypothetical protein
VQRNYDKFDDKVLKAEFYALRKAAQHISRIRRQEMEGFSMLEVFSGFLEWKFPLLCISD